jgi:hypothetical protein
VAENSQNLFQDLPQALVEELLSTSNSIGEQILDSFMNVADKKQEIRYNLHNDRFILKDSDFGIPPIPTTCGIDGSYAMEKLLAVDMAACASVAVEGMSPPSEKRFWPQPHFKSLMKSVAHREEMGNILRAIMMAYELLLVLDAPHDIVLLDGSLTTPIIYFNQALNKFEENPDNPLAEELLDSLYRSFTIYVDILKSVRSDRICCALPKYSTRREIGEKYDWEKSFNDRAVLTHVLDASECTTPLPISRPNAPWHLNTKPFNPDEFQNIDNIEKQITESLSVIHVMYYKPYNWMPAFRIEMGSSVAKNRQRIAVLLQGLKHQCTTPGIMEPYPLYLADRMVKHLSRVVPAVRQVATQNMAMLYEGDMGEIFYSMHGYRTESGRA